MDVKFEYYDGGYNLLQLAFGDSKSYTRLVIPPEDLNLLASMTLGAQGIKPSYGDRFGWKRARVGGAEQRVSMRIGMDPSQFASGNLKYTLSTIDAEAAQRIGGKPIPLELFVQTQGVDSSQAAIPGFTTRTLNSDWRFTFNKKQAKAFTRWVVEAATANNMMSAEPGDETWDLVQDTVYAKKDGEVFKLWAQHVKDGLAGM